MAAHKPACAVDRLLWPSSEHGKLARVIRTSTASVRQLTTEHLLHGMYEYALYAALVYKPTQSLLPTESLVGGTSKYNSGPADKAGDLHFHTQVFMFHCYKQP